MIENACVLFEEIESTSGSKAKAELLASSVAQEFKPAVKLLLKLALDPFLTFGVKKFDDGKVHTEKIPTIADLTQLGTQLVKRQVTGNAAVELLQNTILVENQLIRKWLIRAFEKNLRFGMTEKSVDKIFPKLIPMFEIGLCEVFNKDGDETSLPKGEWIIDPKLDGLRCLCFIDANGGCRFLSRGNKPLFNVGHIEEEIKSSGLTNLVLDGEIMAKDWNETVSIVHTESKKENSENLSLYVFDILTMDEWDSKKSHPLSTRKSREGLLPKNAKFVSPVPYVHVKNLEEANKEMDLYLKKGFEGAVLKNWDSEYPFGRGRQWLKWKKMHTTEVRIVDKEEGTGKHVGRLGKFICDYNGVSVDVGNGYTDEMRQEFWDNFESYKGRLIEVQYQDITVENKLRFPVFLRFRVDME